MTTTRDLAACGKAVDQPVCLLRALAKFPTHSSYRTDWRLVGADQVLSAVGEASQPYANIPYASTRLVYGELRNDAATVAAVILAERRGASPEDALAFIRERRGAFSQLTPEIAPLVRCHLYMDVHRAFGRPAERASRPRTPRPSRALALAAIRACEAENRTGDEFSTLVIARAYAALGERGQVARVLGHEAAAPGEPARAVMERALLLGDLDAAVRAALTAEPLTNDREESARILMQQQVLDATVDAGRTDLARTLSIAVLDAALSQPRAQPTHAAMMVLVGLGDREVATRYIDRLDAAGRDFSSARSFEFAVAAVKGWLRLGDRERASQIVGAWIPRIEGCGGEPRFCAGGTIVQMLVEIGRAEEAYRLSPNTPANFLLGYEIEGSDDVARLDVHLAHIRTERDVNVALQSCAGRWGNTQRRRWALACAQRLVARAETDPSAASPALKAVIQLAGTAARAGDFDLMNDMLKVAMALAATAPETPLEGGSYSPRDALLEVAIAQLEVAGRL